MELLVRAASEKDFPDLADISRNTWDGHDYLEQVSGAWLRDGHFIVGEVAGKVIACGKITVMPDNIAWLEGLRVHPGFQGKGYGKEISRRILNRACEGVSAGEFTAVEFSTYVNNVESRNISEKQGFEVTEWFHVVSREGPFPACDLEVTESEIRKEDLSIYRQHAPCGWKYIHSTASGSTGWFRANARIWQVSTGARFLSCNRGFEISPLTSSLSDPDGFLAGALKLVAGRDDDYSEMMIHDSHRTLLEAAIGNGWEYWEKPGGANIPVYRFTGISNSPYLQ